MDPQSPGSDQFLMRRGEWIAILLFVALNLAAPVAQLELYPFSRFPMFAGTPTHVAIYRVTDPSGRELPTRDFGLKLNSDDNPPRAGHGYLPPPTLDEIGAVATPAAVRAWVEERLASGAASVAFVEVTRTVYGPASDGSFGPVTREAWRIHTPPQKDETRP